MKKNVIATAVAGAVASYAAVSMAAESDAMYLNDRLTGEALVLPFYTAQNGNNTYFQLVNTTGGYKAVKIRMVEAWNSREVLDFNVYMSPKDHFSFNIKADGEGAKLVTVDNTCTVPEIPKVDADDVTPPIKREVAFRNSKYATDKGGTGDTAFDNTGEFREQIGYIEVIEMGQINPASAPLVDSGTGAINVAAAIKHGADGVPADCSVPVAGWSSPTPTTPGAWIAEYNGADGRGKSEFFTNWQGGGLYAYGTVLNVSEGTSIGEDAVAIEQLLAAGSSGYATHYEPGSVKPNFSDEGINKEALVSTPDSGAPEYLTFSETQPDVLGVSALFMSSTVMNDYVVDPAIAADTDWVLTFPTKYFHVNATTPAGVEDPFTVEWNKKTACEPSQLLPYDREEAFKPPPSSGPDFSPMPETQEEYEDLLLCYEVTVLQFGDDSALNVSGVATGVSTLLQGYTEGWAELDISESGVTDTYPIDATSNYSFDRVITPDTGVSLEGLPVTGFAAISYVNSDANEAGALANYAMSTEHKTDVATSSNLYRFIIVAQQKKRPLCGLFFLSIPKHKYHSHDAPWNELSDLAVV